MTQTNLHILCSLIGAFVICYLESITAKLTLFQNFNVLASHCSGADWFWSYLVRNPEGLFRYD